jgi:hypothetical protein
MITIPLPQKTTIGHMIAFVDTVLNRRDNVAVPRAHRSRKCSKRATRH